MLSLKNVANKVNIILLEQHKVNAYLLIIHSA